MRYMNVRSTAAVLAGLALVVLTASVIAQHAPVADGGVSHERLQRIGQMIDRRIEAHDIPGAVTLVAINGQVVEFEARGFLDLDSKRPMPKDAIFPLASLTKPVTTVAVLMLVEEGRIRLQLAPP